MDALATWTGVLHVTAAAVLTLAGEIHRGVNAVQRLGKLLRDHRLVGRGADGSAIRGGRARGRGALARAGGRRLWHAHCRALLRGVAHVGDPEQHRAEVHEDRKSTRLNSSHEWSSYAVFCLKKKKKPAPQVGGATLLMLSKCKMYYFRRI